LKTHAKHVALGGVLAPLILAIAAAIANGAQQALNLNLHGTGLAIFLVGFVAGAALVTQTSIRAEASKVLSSAGGLGGLMDMVGELFGEPAEPAVPTSPATGPIVPPPPPPPTKLPGGEN
jgi:hypothetical protein